MTKPNRPFEHACLYAAQNLLDQFTKTCEKGCCTRLELTGQDFVNIIRANLDLEANAKDFVTLEVAIAVAPVANVFAIADLIRMLFKDRA